MVHTPSETSPVPQSSKHLCIDDSMWSFSVTVLLCQQTALASYRVREIGAFSAQSLAPAQRAASHAKLA